MWVKFGSIFIIIDTIFCEYEHVFTTSVDNTALLELYPEDAKLNGTQLASKYGYKVEEHEVVTEDGYLITIFRLPGKGNGKPLMVLHGVIDSSDTWMLRGNTSIGFDLVNAGFDVWFGNYRGNRYGRKHMYLNPDRHAHFWNYSYHDTGYYDVAATIDYIIENTGESRVKALAQSQGTTVFYVLLSTRPEYNEKLEVLVSLAPVSYVHHASGSAVPILVPLILAFNGVLNLLGQHELLGEKSIPKVMLQFLCYHYVNLCAEIVIYPLSGVSGEQIELEFLRSVMGRYPSASSRKNFVHVSQNRVSKKFSQFDYGRVRNLRVYGSKHPPDYDVSKITAKIALICSKNDGLSSLKDVELLRRQLPNVVEYFVIKNDKWTHADFLWGRGIRKYVMPKILELLNKY